MRVLICDDAMFMRAVLRKILETMGHTVVGEASNGKEAVLLYKKIKPDVITMDITMPNMNGIEALREIRKIDNDAKVLMCSAMGQKYNVLDAIQAGAVDFIVKPFNSKKVMEALEKCEKKI